MFSGSQKYPTLPIDYKSMVLQIPQDLHTENSNSSSSQIIRKLLNEVPTTTDEIV